MLYLLIFIMYKTPVQYDSKECMYLLKDSYLHVQLENGKNLWCRQCLQEAELLQLTFQK